MFHVYFSIQDIKYFQCCDVVCIPVRVFGLDERSKYSVKSPFVCTRIGYSDCSCSKLPEASTSYVALVAGHSTAYLIPSLGRKFRDVQNKFSDALIGFEMDFKLRNIV